MFRAPKGAAQLPTSLPTMLPSQSMANQRPQSAMPPGTHTESEQVRERVFRTRQSLPSWSNDQWSANRASPNRRSVTDEWNIGCRSATTRTHSGTHCCCHWSVHHYNHTTHLAYRRWFEATAERTQPSHEWRSESTAVVGSSGSRCFHSTASFICAPSHTC